MVLGDTKLLFFVVVFFYTQLSFSQEKSEISLSDALEIISNKHGVFFTFNPEIIQEDRIDITALQDINLKQSINLLEKVTPYNIEYLGKNFYVLYQKTSEAEKNNPEEKNQKLTVKGIVLDADNFPIPKVNVLEINTPNGTTSLKDGTFSLTLQEKNNALNFSHIGYKTKTVNSSQKFLIIILDAGIELDEIMIVGSRNHKRTKIDAPVATDVVDITEIENKSSFLEINQLLQSEIPSFNATKQSGSDGADHVTPTTYRGLGPDQTLVLVNGKRRHQTSLINLYGTRGRGNSGTDINTIPTAAIKRIEILKDGASAQYGSDAIAGVINVVLKDSTNFSNINFTTGLFNANKNINPNRKGLDGFTHKTAVNYGTSILKNGFINFTGEFLSQNHTFRRSTNTRKNYGSPAIENKHLFLNIETPLLNKFKTYANIGYSDKDTEAYAFTRDAFSERNVLDIYPNGFDPIIGSNIIDKSFTIGVKGKINRWNIDFSNSYGKNFFQYTITNTLNATLLDKSPTKFNAGGHSLSQNTTNLDLSKNFPTIFNGLHLALGLEKRIENYKIFAGETASFASYDNNGKIVTENTPTMDLPMFNGIIRPGGSQGFPGYAPYNEVNRTRNSFSFYLDNEIDFSKTWLLATALRFENFSDFGSTLNTKIASRVKISPSTNFRTSFSTGFRAPSLAQIYYSLKFTDYIDNNPIESFLIANNNPITQQFGIEELTEEKAINYSVGINHRFNDNFYFSLDSYYIFIKDRIILSGGFDVSNTNTDIEKVQFFANGVNTSTYGIDLRINWHKKFDNSSLDIGVSGNINNMRIDKINHKNLHQETFFGIREQYFLLASAPKHKIIIRTTYSNNNFSWSNLLTRYSNVTLIDWQINQPITNFNNSSEQRFNNSIDHYVAKYTLDSHFSYRFTNNFSLQAGVNNLLNTYPTTQGSNTDSGGLWDAVQMGSDGAFYYTKVSFNL